MCAPSAPTPADPAQTAQAQTGMNVNTAIANQVLGQTNQVGPNGSLTYRQTGSQTITDPNTGQTYQIPSYTATTRLTPELAQANRINQRSQVNLARTGNRVSGQLLDHFGEEFNLDGVRRGGNANAVGSGTQTMLGGRPNLQENVAQGGIRNQIAGAGAVTRSYGTDFSEDRQRVESALMERMNPSLQQDRQALEARLASQGIGIGSQAYQAAMGDFSQQSNDARLGAILAGGEEQSRMVGMERDRAGFQNAAQQQQFGQNAMRSQFANDAQGQQFGQDLQQVGLRNAARQGEFDNRARQVQQNNAARTQGQQNNLTEQQYFDQTRARDIQERLMLRNQPLNEISALMSGSQVSMPQFGATPQGTVANTDYAGLVANQDAMNQQNYQTQLGGWNMLAGGLGGGIGALIGGGR